MLTDVRSNCLFHPQGPGLSPGLRDEAAAFPLMGSASSKAKHISQRHRHIHTQIQRTLTLLVTQTATDKALSPAAPTFRTHTGHRHRQPCPLLLLGWQRQKVTGIARTPHSPCSQACANSWIPQAPA